MTHPRAATVRKSTTTPRRLRAGLGNPVTASPRVAACASTCSIKTESAAGTEKRGAGQAAAIKAGPSEDGREGDSMTHHWERRGPGSPPPYLGSSQIRGPPGRRKADRPRGQTLSPARAGPAVPIPCKPQRSPAQSAQVSPLSQVARLAADRPPCGCASATLSSDSMTSSTSPRPKQPPIPCGLRANSDAWASGRGKRSDPGLRQVGHNEERPSR